MSSCFTDLEVARKHEGRCRNLYMCSLQCVSRKTHVQALMSPGSVCSTFALVHTGETSVKSHNDRLVPRELPFSIFSSFTLSEIAGKLAMCNTTRLSFKPKWCHKNPISEVKSVEGSVKPSSPDPVWLVICQQAVALSERISALPCWFLYLFWVVFALCSYECIFLCFLWLCSQLETHPAYMEGSAATCLISLMQDKQLEDGWMAGSNSREFAFKIWNNLMRMGIEIFSSEYEPYILNLNLSNVLIEILGESSQGDANKDQFSYCN